ncbi:MAG: ABC transporter ATP-binding protein [Methylococcales bacterium]|jgi:ABC-2 type transport system ATP-binding protein|nr:ABC transporter ATP-binding protein [Methylococcales bacterium]MBT7445541.1 ABC transporter ATP-binding protein [Methylococcales bacterium]
MNALSVKQLVKTYKNGVTALKGIDLDVEEGDFYALLGANGAGKSTLISILCSLLNKTSGQISVFGHDLDNDNTRVKQSLGLVPQEFNFNIFEPIIEILVNQAGFYGINRATAFPRAHELLEALGLGAKKQDSARQLSGGMKRRLMIARALMHQPKLLVLDEPTAGVDIEIRHSLWQYLTELNNSGTTIILTTHYLEEAEQLCRNIGIISEGKVIENTSMKDLLSSLKKECFIIETSNPLSAPPSLSIAPTKLVDEHSFYVELEKSRPLNTLFEELSKLQIEVTGMRSKNNRLEELFINRINADSAQ